MNIQGGKIALFTIYVLLSDIHFVFKFYDIYNSVLAISKFPCPRQLPIGAFRGVTKGFNPNAPGMKRSVSIACVHSNRFAQFSCSSVRGEANRVRTNTELNLMDPSS